MGLLSDDDAFFFLADETAGWMGNCSRCNVFESVGEMNTSMVRTIGSSPSSPTSSMGMLEGTGGTCWSSVGSPLTMALLLVTASGRLDMVQALTIVLVPQQASFNQANSSRSRDARCV